MTDDLAAFLDAAEARAAAATPGPWRYWNDGWVGVAVPEGQASPPVVAPARQAWKGEEPCPHDGSHAATNAEFIAAARSDLPVLVGMVRAVLAKCEEAEASEDGRYLDRQGYTPSRVRAALLSAKPPTPEARDD